MAWELCTKDEVIAIHHTEYEKLPDLWSDIVEDMIRQHLGAEYYGTSQVITAETHNGDNTNILLVNKPPIISVEEVRVSGISTPATSYVVFPNHIALRAQNFPDGILNVQIDYTSGQTTVRPIVKLTAISMIAAIMTYQGRYGADGSVKWGTGDQQIGEENPNKRIGLTSNLKVIMRRLLRREKVRAS
jgi:hypothetical protein